MKPENTAVNDYQKSTAQTCLKAAEDDTLAFPAIAGALIKAGFESYVIDFRRTTATYYLPDGHSLELVAHRVETPIAASLNIQALQSAIKEALQHAAGYTYKGFCEKAAAAGCASYFVSFSGRRALYVGPTAETHVEKFPDQWG